MVVGNTLSEIGDVLIVDTVVSITADYLQLVSYSDSTINETATRYFDKKFRVSQNGLIFTDWYELTNPNVSQIQGTVINNTLYIQYRYERVGTDDTGVLEFVSVNILGNVIPHVCNSPTADNSIFKGLSCGNFVTMQLCNNLLKKLYKSGIIPQYIERGGTVEEDEDYIAFWSSIACYMSMFVTFMTRFETMYMDRDLLIEYIKQMGLYVCENETTLEDLQYLANKYFDEIRKRGTKQVFMRKGDQFEDLVNVAPIDGEVLRLLCVDECDEFLWTLRDLTDIGWSIGNSSPMWKGTNFDDNLIKGFEKTKNCLDLSKYLLFGSSNISNLSQITMDLLDSTTQKVGIGFENFLSEPTVKDLGVVVNPNLDYEITFQIAVDSLVDVPKINFGANVYDCFDNKFSLRTIDTNVDSDRFLTDWEIKQVGVFYFVRGIIYANDQTSIPDPDSRLNVGAGVNLRFPNTRVNKMMPYLEVLAHVKDNSTPPFLTTFQIYDFKIRPLRYDHSFCFLNTANILEIFAANNNDRHVLSEINDIIRRDLIPYNTNLNFNSL